MEFLLGLGVGVLGIVATIVVAVIQERKPRLTAECRLTDDRDPCALICRVTNHGRGEARDVQVAFNWALPADTMVFGPPELAAQIVESNVLPDPRLLPAGAKLMKAFSVHVPRITTKSSIEFTVRTTDGDNIRAGRQVLRIRKHVEQTVDEIAKRLGDVAPSQAQIFDLDAFKSGRAKQESFFTPGKFTYEQGTFDLHFREDSENLAFALYDDLTARFSEQIGELLKARKTFKAPVVKIKTAEGFGTFAVFFPFTDAQIEMRVPIALLAKGKPITLEPPIPESYD